MMNSDILSPQLLNQSYQQGWEKSLREFNSQRAKLNHGRPSEEIGWPIVELKWLPNKHTDK